MRDPAPVALALWAALLVSPLSAADLVVTRYDDPSPDGCSVADCSLREAVIEANAVADLDRIVLSAGTYQLHLVEALAGGETGGQLELTSEIEIRGPSASMTFIDANGNDAALLVSTDNGDVTLEGLALSGAASFAAGVLQNATLRLRECEVRDNPASAGALLTNPSSTLVVERSLVASNGAVGISLSGGSATVSDSTITGNGSIEISLHGAGSSLLCSHCTVADSGTVLQVNGFNGGSATVGNSVILGTCSTFNGGVLASTGGNVESNGTTCGFASAGDQSGVSTGNLALVALGGHGGPTRTRPLGAGSTAFDGGLGANCSDFDQRGVARPIAPCDPGAVESAASQPLEPIFHDGFEQGDAEAWITVGGPA